MSALSQEQHVPATHSALMCWEVLNVHVLKVTSSPLVSDHVKVPYVLYTVIDSLIAICKAHYVDNVELESKLSCLCLSVCLCLSLCVCLYVCLSVRVCVTSATLSRR